jgi:simple sugar transport system permease protein
MDSLKSGLKRFMLISEMGPLLILIALSIGFYLANPAFLSPLNISNMLAYIPELGIIALGMTLLLTAGEIDLSVGAVFAFAPVTMFVLSNAGHVSIEIAFFIALILSALVGLANGLLVTKIKINSLLVTIGMMLIVRGLALYISNGFPQATWSVETILKDILIGKVGSIGGVQILASLLWFIFLIVILHVVLRDTRFGNWIMATGGNDKAAMARGVNTSKVRILLFIISAVLSGFAGIISSLRVSSAYPVAGTGYELEVIAMTVIGGTLLFGGRGTILGTVIGVVLLRTIRNGIIMVGVPGLAYNIFVGAIILIMMAVHSYIERKQLGEG